MGFGGSCFQKDILALIYLAECSGLHEVARYWQAVIDMNNYRKKTFFQRIYKELNSNLSNKKIAIWGLAFKPNTDDIREAPSLFIIEDLLNAGAEIVAYDPEAMPNIEQYFATLPNINKSNLQFTDNYYKATEQADFLVILTEWTEFRTPDFSRVKSALKQPIIFDGRNLYDLDVLEKEGFYYNSIGRKTITANK